MKNILPVTLCILCYSCFPSRDIQAEMVDATLVKVVEISRYPDIKQKMLTWQTNKAISFVTYESATVNIPIGTQAKVLLQK